MIIPSSLLSNRKSVENESKRRILSRSSSDVSDDGTHLLLKESLQISSRASSHADATAAVATQAPSAAASPQVVVVLGLDISNLDANQQFSICAGGTFGFTLLYGTLQELVIVHIAGRKLAFFLAACQFLWFTIWSILLVALRHRFNNNNNNNNRKEINSKSTQPMHESTRSGAALLYPQFVALALIRALDVTVSNLSMKYLNYPARTLIKSSRVVFTMMMGVIIQNKRYKFQDYFAVTFLVVGLAIFLHADFTSSAVFHPFGVFLLILSLTCDGFSNNWSEKMMKQYGLTQDDYHLRLYSLSFVASLIGAFLKKEVWLGIHHFFLVPGTVAEIEGGVYGRDPPTWSVSRKMIVICLLYMTGLFGGSCLGAITRRFGALAMTLTSTTRKAATMFVSFTLFAHNTCTSEHVLGMTLYIMSLLLKGYNKAPKQPPQPQQREEKPKSPAAHDDDNKDGNKVFEDVENAFRR